MDNLDLRTYRRRQVTRTSGYHTCDDTTGGECIVVCAEKYSMENEKVIFTFFKKEIELIELFTSSIGVVGFGGYIYPSNEIKVIFHLEYIFQGTKEYFKKEFLSPINTKDWNNIGFHKEISMDTAKMQGDLINMTIKNVKVTMEIVGEIETKLEFVSFDFNAITKNEFMDSVFKKSFYQRTSMHIPYLYYLESEKKFDDIISEEITLTEGQLVILKSCNRCGRFLPINITNELSTLSFSLHCKKNAPCKHSTFSSYTILNLESLSQEILDKLPIKDDKLISYYGHQLECKACKKFFVNAPLNPQRNPQQFKEDGLRRRALEVLVNKLMERNLIHFEFEKHTKKEFSEHIWKKFDERCFKCKKKIRLDEMHLDHTRPLAYLYRLDESATCLCSTHNSQKSDSFPVDFYTEDELVELSEITNLPVESLKKREVNEDVLNLLIDNVVWYFDVFLMNGDYQRIRDGILTADKINESIRRVINGKVNLVEKYVEIKNEYPKSITRIENK